MHGYEHGRLDLPFVDHCTFGKRPPCLDWDALDADVAVLGFPFDMGTQYRFGPRTIRTAILAAQIPLNFLGFIFHEKSRTGV